MWRMCFEGVGRPAGDVRVLTEEKGMGAEESKTMSKRGGGNGYRLWVVGYWGPALDHRFLVGKRLVVTRARSM